MASNDSDYYRQRADEERQLARSAINEDIGRLHDELADLYEGLVGPQGPEPMPAV